MTDSPFPALNPEQKLADLRAPVAANEKGAEQLTRLVDRYSEVTVAAYISHLKDPAKAAVRDVIGALKDGELA